jgi:microcystin degradation protein MlrC
MRASRRLRLVAGLGAASVSGREDGPGRIGSVAGLFLLRFPVARIAVAGFQHETNTFSPHPATLAEFVAADAWPGLVVGPAVVDAVSGINLPAAGFVTEARGLRHEVEPLLWCSAQPSGRVTRHAFEHISALLLQQLKNANRIDALYLDLHGAMVAEHVDDADGELLRRVRAVLGPDIPIVASLDYHANVSPQMAAQASALVVYRTYPHVDMAETGARAARCLHDLLRSPRPHAALRQIDFLIPLTSQATLVEPMLGLTAVAARLEREARLVTLSIAPGFPAADVAECGPSVYACGHDAARAASAADQMADAVRSSEPLFALAVHSIADACAAAVAAHERPRGRPLVIADTQDNPGAGGHADTTSLLKALLAAGARRVLAGVLCDAGAAARAHATGVGRSADFVLGAGSGFSGETPITRRFEVAALGDGRFLGTGPFYRGGRFELGPMALLRADDILFAVSSRKQQAADQAMFRHLGVEPAEFATLVLKSSVHFRADFGPLAGRIMIVAAPGPNLADPAQLPFQHLRPGMRFTRGVER